MRDRFEFHEVGWGVVRVAGGSALMFHALVGAGLMVFIGLLWSGSLAIDGESLGLGARLVLVLGVALSLLSLALLIPVLHEEALTGRAAALTVALATLGIVGNGWFMLEDPFEWAVQQGTAALGATGALLAAVWAVAGARSA